MLEICGFRPLSRAIHEENVWSGGSPQPASPAISPNRESGAEGVVQDAVQGRVAPILAGVVLAGVVLGFPAVVMRLALIEHGGIGDEQRASLADRATRHQAALRQGTIGLAALLAQLEAGRVDGLLQVLAG